MLSLSEVWKIFIDGSSNTKGSGAIVILEGPYEINLKQTIRLNFPTSNNQAEYEALITGVKLAKEVGATKLKAYSGSQLVTLQISKEYQTKDPQLMKYLEKVNDLGAKFKEFSVAHTRRESNTRADNLSKFASTKRSG